MAEKKRMVLNPPPMPTEEQDAAALANLPPPEPAATPPPDPPQVPPVVPFEQREAIRPRLRSIIEDDDEGIKPLTITDPPPPPTAVILPPRGIPRGLPETPRRLLQRIGDLQSPQQAQQSQTVLVPPKPDNAAIPKGADPAQVAVNAAHKNTQAEYAVDMVVEVYDEHQRQFVNIGGAVNQPLSYVEHPATYLRYAGMYRVGICPSGYSMDATRTRWKTHRSGGPPRPPQWYFDASEIPVLASDGQQQQQKEEMTMPFAPPFPGPTPQDPVDSTLRQFRSFRELAKELKKEEDAATPQPPPQQPPPYMGGMGFRLEEERRRRDDEERRQAEDRRKIDEQIALLRQQQEDYRRRAEDADRKLELERIQNAERQSRADAERRMEQQMSELRQQNTAQLAELKSLVNATPRESAMDKFFSSLPALLPQITQMMQGNQQTQLAAEQRAREDARAERERAREDAQRQFQLFESLERARAESTRAQIDNANQNMKLMLELAGKNDGSQLFNSMASSLLTVSNAQTSFFTNMAKSGLMGGQQSPWVDLAAGVVESLGNVAQAVVGAKLSGGGPPPMAGIPQPPQQQPQQPPIRRPPPQMPQQPQTPQLPEPIKPGIPGAYWERMQAAARAGRPPEDVARKLFGIIQLVDVNDLTEGNPSATEWMRRLTSEELMPDAIKEILSGVGRTEPEYVEKTISYFWYLVSNYVRLTTQNPDEVDEGTDDEDAEGDEGEDAEAPEQAEPVQAVETAAPVTVAAPQPAQEKPKPKRRMVAAPVPAEPPKEEPKP